MRIQTLVTIFVILCKSRKVMIMMSEFERQRKDVIKMMFHTNYVFADTIIL